MNKSPAHIPFWTIAAVYFALLIALLFGDAFANGSKAVPGRSGMDLFTYFYPVRIFAIDQIRNGHLPLWNPYILGGLPALANFQYALLYPPNWLHLLLPMNLTINLLIAFHVGLAGFFTALWCRQHSSSAASTLGGTIFALSGPSIQHVSMAYLTYLCVMAWIPALFICVDRVIDLHGHRRWHFVLLGGMVVAMQVLAGYPQPAFYSALASFVYSTARLTNRPKWISAITALAAMYAIGALLSAAQLMPGLEATSESIRGGPVDYAFATSCSLAPENILLIFSSSLFGDDVSAPDMARWGSTQTSMFIGVVATLLATIGAVAKPTQRKTSLVVAILCALFFALGSYNPLYHQLIQVIPGLGSMRYPARFVVMISFLVSPLAASGFDCICGCPKLRWPIATASIIAGGFFLSSIIVSNSATAGSDGIWGRYLHRQVATGETWHKLRDEKVASQIQRNAQMAAEQMLLIAAAFSTMALILCWARIRPTAVYLLLPLAVLELFIGSAPAWDRTVPSTALPRQWHTELGLLSPDDRLLTWLPNAQNLTLPLKIEAVNGYDPSVLARWDSVLRPLLGAEARSGNLEAKRILPSSRWPMLRLAKVLPHNEGFTIPRPMPRLNLISHYSVAPDATESLLAVRRPTFDPRRSVILEQEPSVKPVPAPEGQSPGSTTLLQFSADALEIQADLSDPSILLITDAYSKGWKARPLRPGPQVSYEVMPANHALRAIPLAAGKHHLVLEYRPRSVRIGFAISGASALAWSAAAIWLLRSARGPRRVTSTM